MAHPLVSPVQKTARTGAIALMAAVYEGDHFQSVNVIRGAASRRDLGLAPEVSEIRFGYIELFSALVVFLDDGPMPERVFSQHRPAIPAHRTNLVLLVLLADRGETASQ